MSSSIRSKIIKQLNLMNEGVEDDTKELILEAPKYDDVSDNRGLNKLINLMLYTELLNYAMTGKLPMWANRPSNALSHRDAVIKLFKEFDKAQADKDSEKDIEYYVDAIKRIGCKS